MEKKNTKKGNKSATTRATQQFNVVDNFVNVLINMGDFVYSQPITISQTRKV